MGQKSSTETVIALVAALLERRTWKQADLARKVGVTPPTVHKRLVELQLAGVPLESKKEHPDVFWTVPKSWYPGGVLLPGEQIQQLFRQLSRMPSTKDRNRLIETLLKFLPGRGAAALPVVTRETTAREEQHLPTIEDSAAQRTALRFRYFSASKGEETSRHASVHAVVPGPPARFVATCHRDGVLKFFRIENVSDARLDPTEAFRACDPKKVEAHVRESLDGFHDGGVPKRHAFFVQSPESRWVARNLMDAMVAEEVPGGIKVSLETAATQRLARFVVGLGAAAKPLTPELAAAVAVLARGALAAIESSPDGRQSERSD